MKFQDDISNMNTYVRTYGQAETNMPPHFFKVGGIKSRFGGGEGQGGCERRIEVFVEIQKILE